MAHNRICTGFAYVTPAFALLFSYAEDSGGYFPLIAVTQRAYRCQTNNVPQGYQHRMNQGCSLVYLCSPSTPGYYEVNAWCTLTGIENLHWAQYGLNRHMNWNRHSIVFFLLSHVSSCYIGVQSVQNCLFLTVDWIWQVLAVFRWHKQNFSGALLFIEHYSGFRATWRCHSQHRRVVSVGTTDVLFALCHICCASM